MKSRYAYIKWDCDYATRKQMETIQHLDLSLHFKDYDFLSEKLGLNPMTIRNIFKTHTLSNPKYLPLLKQAVKEQLLRDVCII
jgi:AraC-like DNA-binding protein